MNEILIKKTLSSQHNFWAHWGFDPWRDGVLAGVARRQKFVKDGFLGRIAEYGAWDYIIWDSGRPEDRQALWDRLTPEPEIMTQRFLFVLPNPWPGRRIKSFWLGFKGYVEFFAYWPPVGPTDKKELPPDLSGLVDLALRPKPAEPAATD